VALTAIYITRNPIRASFQKLCASFFLCDQTFPPVQDADFSLASIMHPQILAFIGLISEPNLKSFAGTDYPCERP
jgi:hypothetical protein